MKVIRHDIVIRMETKDIEKAVFDYLVLNNYCTDKDIADIKFDVFNEEHNASATVTITTK